jgi:transcriptional regulator with XRE-family HTH domain
MMTPEDRDFYRRCGMCIAAARDCTGMTVRQVARKVGVGERTVERWESGDGILYLGDMKALCDAFDMPPEKLFGDLTKRYTFNRARVN